MNGGELDRRIRELEHQQVEISRELGQLKNQRADASSQFDSCREEARGIAHQMNDWKPLQSPLPFSDAPAALLFFGAVSGEWAAQSRYRGELPGFGGFLLVAGGLQVLIDPGRSTLSNLHAADIHPRTLDWVISTHSHWDCVRDLPLVVMAATDTHLSGIASGSPRLKLLAAKSVLFGHPMDVDAVVHDPYFRRTHDIDATRTRLASFPTMNGPALNSYDLFVRLAQQFDILEIDKRYALNAAVELRTRASYHRDTFGLEAIPALDIVVRPGGKSIFRCVYLSDTEYRSDLADIYAADLDELGTIDVLICNVKTLDVRPQTEGPYKGYTLRHLGWHGLCQVTKDLRAKGLLTPASLVVLRAWGIETVTRLDPADKVMTATCEKLRVYEEAYEAATGQNAVVPGQTWVVAANDRSNEPPAVHHLRAPYPARGAFQRFGSVFYCSDQMAEVVRAVLPVVDNSSELLMVTGETGTGKDELAKSIHRESNRQGPVVIENAASLGRDTGYGQLVGYSRGAFTDAKADVDGWLTEAARGTLIIQEIGDMPEEDQIKLLTILQERKYRRLGDRRKYELTAQVIMTTSRDVDSLIAEGKFRPELLYRFQRRVHIPPLRDRLDDIRAIVQGWHVDDPQRFPVLDEPVIALLRQHPWPGNVRSLENALTRVRASGNWSAANIAREAMIEQRSAAQPARGPGADGPELSPEESELLVLIPPDAPIRRGEIAAQLPGINKTTINNRLRRLVSKGLVRKIGGGPQSRYQRNRPA